VCRTGAGAGWFFAHSSPAVKIYHRRDSVPRSANWLRILQRASWLLWLVATVRFWRETQEERSARLRAVGRDGGGPGIPCPTCGYDMTGLNGTRCPECGSEFTVGELLAAHPRVRRWSWSGDPPAPDQP
jgi:hypothetical protein